jgi:hypothetical protein
MKKSIVSIGLSVVLSVIITGMLLTTAPGCTRPAQFKYPGKVTEITNDKYINFYLLEYEGRRFLTTSQGGIIELGGK